MQIAHTIAELARGVGRSPAAVQKWIRHPKWNQDRKPPYDVEVARAWAAATLQIDRAAHPGPMDLPDDDDQPDGKPLRPMSAAKLQLLVTRAAKLELERKVLAGELIERAEVERGRVRRVHTVRAAFEGLPRQLAGTLVGQSETEIERIMEQAIRDVLVIMSGRPELVDVEEDE